MVKLRAIIFDLDGVITDTSEYHYLAWRRLADEEGMPFDRQINERLRGISRRASLEVMLAEAGRQATEEEMAEMMARKNRYYRELLNQVTPANLLPGALGLIQELRAAGIKVALGSASRNARTVLERLGIAELMDVVADGYSVSRTKPAPDLFLWAAEQLGLSPGLCAVVEDAKAGIDAALAAGMWAIGLGPEERVGHAHARFDNLQGVTLADIEQALEAASWTVAEAAFEPQRQNHKETVFTIGNGYLCLRGSFEEGYPGQQAASFVHRVWDYVPLHVTELANLPYWLGVDIWVNGQRFRLDQGNVLSYRRQLNLRNGVLSRRVRWQPASQGPVVELVFERFASLAEQHLAAMRVQARVVEGQEVDLRLRTGFDIHSRNPLPAAPVPDMGLPHWRLMAQGQTADEIWLQARTLATQVELGLAATIGTTGTVSWQEVASDADGQPSVERRAILSSGGSLTLEKYVAIVAGPEVRDPLAQAQALARQVRAQGYQALRQANDAAWARTWEVADVLIEGDIEAQIGLRFALFQLLIAAPRECPTLPWGADRASIGAKTLSGFGYRHHVFWDTEIFMLPLFIYTQPELARNMLMYRWHNLPGAREKARSNGYEGAQFPWESASDGREVTPAWVPHYADPRQLIRIWTGEIEIHITADIAYAVMHYWRVTGDDAWMRDYGAELVLDGARFWASAARREEDGKYHFRNVIGPDEYHDRVDDNAFTNYMARWHLETALEVLAWLRREYPEKHAQLSAALDLSEERLAHWADVLGCLWLPVDPETGLIEQFAGYFDLEDADVARLRDPQRSQSMQALLGVKGCAMTQVLKQPDVLMLQYLLADRFGVEEVRTNYEYYDPRTDHEHGSSLGPAISAIMACRVGDQEMAYQHFMRAARTDLQDVRHNTCDGIHGAAAGGLWQAVVFGFAGLRLHDSGWSVEPRLPRHWTRLAFKFYQRGELQTVDLRR